MDILTEISLEDLAIAIAEEDQNEVTDFVIELDMRIADYDFTQNLIEKLQKSLDEEDAWQKDE